MPRRSRIGFGLLGLWLVWATPSPAAIMAFSGFETGDTAEFDAVSGTVSAVNTPTRTGRFALSVNDGVNWVEFPSASNELQMRVAILPTVTSYSSTGAWIPVVAAGRGAVIGAAIEMRATSSSTIELRAVSVAAQTGGVSFATGAFLLLEIWGTRDDTTGTVSWKVDGVAQTGLSSVDTNPEGNYSESRLGFQAADASNAVTIVYDDAMVGNAVATLGDGRCGAYQGSIDNETPTYDQWTKTAGAGPIESAWSAVPAHIAGAVSPATGDPLAQTMNTQNVDPVSAGATLFSQNAGTEITDVSIFGGTAGSGETGQARGQGFTPSTTITVDVVAATVGWASTPTDSVLVEIVSGSIDGTVLASSTTHMDRCHQDNNSPDDGLWPLNVPVTLTGSTEYFLRVSRTGARDATNYVDWTRETSSTITGSRYVRSNNTWSSVDSTDHRFYLRGNGGAIASDATINACKVGVVALRSSGGGRTHEIRRRFDTTDTDTAVTLTTTAAYYGTAIFTTTYANLNLAQIGGEKSGGAAGQSMTIYDAWLMCDYLNPAAAPSRNRLRTFGAARRRDPLLAARIPPPWDFLRRRPRARAGGPPWAAPRP